MKALEQHTLHIMVRLLHISSAYVAGETSSKANYKITFNQIDNYQPKINSIPIEIANEDVQWSYTLNVTDLNNDKLSVSVTKPDWLTWNEATKTLSGTLVKLILVWRILNSQ